MDLTVLAAGVLLILAVLSVRLSERLRMPVLLLFLGLGMAAGSEGPGGIAFDSPGLAQSVGTVCLVVILFAGGLDTAWSSVRSVVGPGLLLATGGVLVSTLILGTAAWWLLGSYTDLRLGGDGISWTEGLLIGAIVSSTDAAAIFGLFRSGSPAPRRRLRSLLELESGTNDPMAVILTVTLIGILNRGEASLGSALAGVLLGIVVGAVLGLLLGGVAAVGADALRLSIPGLYPVLCLGVALTTYGTAQAIEGNGFLAVYLCGLVLGNRVRSHRRLIIQVSDALAWIAQIAMFITMGLLVFPSELVGVAPVGIVLALILMFLARPVSVFLCLLPSGFSARESAYVSWAGLRGAVPVVLATFPATAGLTQAGDVFGVVFFLVVVSVLVQGFTLGPVGRRLGIEEPAGPPT